MKKFILLAALVTVAGTTPAQASEKDQSGAAQCWVDYTPHPGFWRAVATVFMRPCVGANH